MPPDGNMERWIIYTLLAVIAVVVPTLAKVLKGLYEARITDLKKIVDQERSERNSYSESVQKLLSEYDKTFNRVMDLLKNMEKK